MKSKFVCMIVSFIIIAFIVGCGSLYGQEKKFAVGAYVDNVIGPNFGGTYYLNRKLFIQIFFGGGWSLWRYQWGGRGIHNRLAYTFLEIEEDECFFLCCDLYTINEIESGKLRALNNTDFRL